MNIDEIPTPETDLFFHYCVRTDHSWLRHSENLERRLTIAREALGKLAKLGNGRHYGNSDGNIIAFDALTLTIPKP